MPAKHSRLRSSLITLLALLSPLFACHAAAPPDPTWPRQSHPAYPVSVALPTGWEAKAGNAAIYPSDTWTLTPKGADIKNVDTPQLVLLVGWAPRGGRQSAYFPGGRDGDEKPVSWEIAGQKVAGLLANQGQVFMADFERGSVVLSARAHATKQEDMALVQRILQSLAIAEKAAVPPEQQERLKALALAQEYAVREGYQNIQIVIIPEISGQGTYHFTVFFSGSKNDSKAGLVPLVVFPKENRVEKKPLTP